MTTIEELAAEVATLRQLVDTHESVLAIQALKASYGELVDQRFARGSVVDDQTLRRVATEASMLFTPDATWDGGPGLGVARGREAITARLCEPTLSFSRHLFMKPNIQVAGDRATARWDLLSPCRRLDGTSCWMCGFEDDEYERIDGVWLHRSMRLTALFMAPVTEGFPRIFA
jgi:SnoaL-like domain